MEQAERGIYHNIKSYSCSQWLDSEIMFSKILQLFLPQQRNWMLIFSVVFRKLKLLILKHVPTLLISTAASSAIEAAAEARFKTFCKYNIQTEDKLEIDGF